VAVCENIGVVAPRQGKMHVLLDEEYGDALTLQCVERTKKLLNKHGRETEREFVDDQDLRLYVRRDPPSLRSVRRPRAREKVMSSFLVFFFLVLHRALPDLQRVKHKPDQAFGHREGFLGKSPCFRNRGWSWHGRRQWRSFRRQWIRSGHAGRHRPDLALLGPAATLPAQDEREPARFEAQVGICGGVQDADNLFHVLDGQVHVFPRRPRTVKTWSNALAFGVAAGLASLFAQMVSGRLCKR
jgi:hypothetical protein